MRNPETSPSLFPVTAWTLVRRIQNGKASPSAEEALDTLCRSYWKPVQQYLKALGCPNNDAPDVTQEFFASFLRSGGFNRADRELGRMRTFIKHAAGNYLKNHRRKAQAQRRGGGLTPESLTDLPDPPERELSLAEQAYDREWAATVLDRALMSVEAGYRERGREMLFTVVKNGLLRSGGVEDAAGAAQQLGIPESQVRLAVHRARQRLAEALREEVRSTVENNAEADAEVRYLLNVIAHRQ